MTQVHTAVPRICARHRKRRQLSLTTCLFSSSRPIAARLPRASPTGDIIPQNDEAHSRRRHAQLCIPKQAAHGDSNLSSPKNCGIAPVQCAPDVVDLARRQPLTPGVMGLGVSHTQPIRAAIRCLLSQMSSSDPIARRFAHTSIAEGVCCENPCCLVSQPA